MKIKCNNKPRQFIYGYELTNKEKQEFDYIDPNELDSHAFVRYKGHVYDVSEFMLIEQSTNTNAQYKGWDKFDGFCSDTFFSGVLIKTIDSDTCVLATYTC